MKSVHLISVGLMISGLAGAMLLLQQPHDFRSTATDASKLSGDLQPPGITGVRVTTIDDHRMELSWHTTMPSTGKVEYGTAADRLDQTVLELPEYTYDHHLQIGFTQPLRQYFRIRATTIRGVESISELFNFRPQK